MNEETINCTSIFLDVRNFTELMKNFSNVPHFFELIENIYKIGLSVVSSFLLSITTILQPTHPPAHPLKMLSED